MPKPHKGEMATGFEPTTPYFVNEHSIIKLAK